MSFLRLISRHMHLLTFRQQADGQGFLNCISCRETVGVGDEKERHSLGLFKWSVALQRSRDLDWETCSVQEIVSAQLLALIEDQAAYRFLAYSGDSEDSKTALLVSEPSKSPPNVHALGLHAPSFGSSPPIYCTQPGQSLHNAR